MGWITDDHLCCECNTKYDILSKTEEREEPSVCPECGGEGERTLSAPMTLKRTYHDGKDRGDGWKRIKEAANIEKAAFSKPESERGDEMKAIKKLRSTKE